MQSNNYTPASVAETVRQYAGVRRKQAIGTLVKKLHIECDEVLADYGEDAAVIRSGNNALLLAADGIWNQLMDLDPYWAGYCSILVNVHDIAAMGGRPIAMVDVLSVSNDTVMNEVSRGMYAAAVAFSVPIVGGHLHPDAPYNVIDVSILGITELDNVIYSSTAKAGDAILMAIDLNGRVHPHAPMNWDSVTEKESSVLQKQLSVMKKLGEKHLLTAGKDISNPGVIGTLGMLLEASHVGGIVDLTSIPHPDLEQNGITFEHWVRMYPGMGFIMTAKQECVDDVAQMFRETGMACQIIGTVVPEHHLILTKGKEKETLFNFSSTGVTNI